MKEKKKRSFWAPSGVIYLLILVVYHLILPIKPISPFFFMDTFPYGWIYAWGIGGTYETFRLHPLSFFVMPGIVFGIYSLIWFICKKMRERKK